MTIIDNTIYSKDVLGVNFDKVYHVLLLLQNISLGYFGVNQKAIYNKEDFIIKEDKSKELLFPTDKKHSINTKKIYKKLLDYIYKEELFKDSELSLFNISRGININRTYLSLSIKEETGDNFHSFINSMRIEEAKNIIESGFLKNHSIESVAKATGFKSKTTFYFWFKKITGKTPHEYKKNKL